MTTALTSLACPPSTAADVDVADVRQEEERHERHADEVRHRIPRLAVIRPPRRGLAKRVEDLDRSAEEPAEQVEPGVVLRAGGESGQVVSGLMPELHRHSTDVVPDGAEGTPQKAAHLARAVVEGLCGCEDHRDDNHGDGDLDEKESDLEKKLCHGNSGVNRTKKYSKKIAFCQRKNKQNTARISGICVLQH